MSEGYSPGPGTEPEYPLSTALLSQRDLGLRVPINFVTEPGVSFSAACFADLRYEDDASGDCLSNLLAVGFRRFELDLFWDQARRLWSFCPVAIPDSVPNAVPSSTSSIASTSTSLGSLTARAESASSLTSFGSEITSLSKVNARQAESDRSSKLSATKSSSFTTLSGSPLGGTQPAVPLAPDTPNTPAITIGKYTCTTTINLSVFTTQLLNYIQKTETTLGAHLLYITFNLHAAASETSPSSPGPEPSTLPRPSELVGTLFSGNLSAYIYTPTELAMERANLNGSWYTVNEQFRPLRGYYETTTNQNNIVSTQDGWPSESYVEFSRSKRLLLGWGNIDPQMAKYNFSGDSGKIFESKYIENFQTDLTASGGQLRTGCYLLNGTQSVSQANSSWAVSTTIFGFNYPISPSSDLRPLLNLTTNLTSCGISPNLNVTLLNSTANTNFIPYLNYTSSTIWSWAPNEPRNATTSDSSDSLSRCASTDPRTGRWSVTDCSQKFPAACRSASQPYNWTLTSYGISYTYASQACPDDFEFAVPMTALENSYLTQRIIGGGQDTGDGTGAGNGSGGQGDSDGDADGHDGRVWIDFNSLDTEDCWVMGGPNATCPYLNGGDLDEEMKRKVILVPAVAVVIVLVITALTVFVKCAGNRKTRRRNKNRKRIRAENGFVYEGVPS